MDYRQMIIMSISVIYYVNCSPYKSDKYMKPLCGDALKNALSLVCHGIYNKGMTKKSDNDLFNFEDYEEPGENYYDDIIYGFSDDRIHEFPFQRKEDIFAMLPNKRQRKHGIVDECCHKPCTEAHLKLYCFKN